jgi:hypothetical protein
VGTGTSSANRSEGGIETTWLGVQGLRRNRRRESRAVRAERQGVPHSPN